MGMPPFTLLREWVPTLKVFIKKLSLSPSKEKRLSKQEEKLIIAFTDNPKIWNIRLLGLKYKMFFYCLLVGQIATGGKGKQHSVWWFIFSVWKQCCGYVRDCPYFKDIHAASQG